MIQRSYPRSPQREDLFTRQQEKPSNYEIHTPAVLKSCRKSSSPSPISSSRHGFPPNKSSILQRLISGPIRTELSSTGNSVLVYGYPMKLRDEILEKFRKLGPIEEIVFSEGNWMTIIYENPASVNKALAYNFTFISEGVMIGVKIKGSLEVRAASQQNILSQTPQNIPNSQYLVKTSRANRPFWSKFMEYVLNYPID